MLSEFGNYSFCQNILAIWNRIHFLRVPNINEKIIDKSGVSMTPSVIPKIIKDNKIIALKWFNLDFELIM